MSRDCAVIVPASRANRPGWSGAATTSSVQWSWGRHSAASASPPSRCRSRKWPTMSAASLARMYRSGMSAKWRSTSLARNSPSSSRMARSLAPAVRAAVALAEVVQEEAQVEGGCALDLVQELAEAGEDGIGRGGDAVQGVDRRQSVLVDRVAVVEVVLDEERHAGELGQQAV